MPPIPQPRQATLWACESLETPKTKTNQPIAGSPSHFECRHRSQSISHTSVNPSEDGESLTISRRGNGHIDEQGLDSFPIQSSFSKATRRDSRRRIFKREWEAVPVAYRSPTPSDFGEETDRRPLYVDVLPPEVYQYLDDRNLDAYAVPTDGNCLYRALLHGPKGSKHDLVRQGTAGYLEALRENNNVLSYLNDGQTEEIRTSTQSI
jgi:hypothetical protein